MQSSLSQYFQSMNQKLDEGYKLSNINCQDCNYSLLIEPNSKSLFCPKCQQNKNVEDIEILAEKQNNLQSDQDSQQVKNLSDSVDQINDQDMQKVKIHQKNIVQNKKMTKTDEYSKKLGEKLLQGWIMLGMHCKNCYVPLMKERQTEQIICVGCSKIFDEVETQQQTNKIQQSNINKPANENKNEKREQLCQKDSTNQQSEMDVLSRKKYCQQQLLLIVTNIVEFYSQVVQQKLQQNESIDIIDQIVKGPLQNVQNLLNNINQNF